MRSLGVGIDQASNYGPTGLMVRAGWGAYAPDPDFEMSKSVLDELTVGVPTQYFDRIAQSDSWEEAYYWRNSALRQEESNAEFARSGITGTASMMFYSIFDPAELALGAATAGYAKAASTGSRLARAAKSGLYTAAVITPGQAVMASQDANYGMGNVFATYLLAGTLGAGAGTVFGKQSYRADYDLNEMVTGYRGMAMGAASPREFESVTPGRFRQMWQEFRDNGLTDKGRERFAHLADPDTIANERIEQAISQHLDPVDDADLIADMRGMSADEKLGFVFDDVADASGEIADDVVDAAGPVQPGDNVAQPGAHRFAPAEWASGTSSHLTRIRASITGRMKSKNIPLLNKFMDATVRDALALADDARMAPQKTDAVSWGQRQRLRIGALHRAQTKTLYRAARDLEPGLTFEQFKDKASSYKQYYDWTSDKGGVPKPYRDYLATIQQAQEEGLALMKQHNVPGASEIEADHNYLNISYNLRKIAKAQRRWAKSGGQGDVLEAYFESAIGDVQVLTDAELTKVSKSIANTIRSKNDWNVHQAMLALDGDQPEYLRMVLEDAGLSPERIDQITTDFAENAKPKSQITGPSTLKRRVLMNRKTTLANDGQVFTLQDFIDTDIDAQTARYTNAAVGASATTQIYDVFGVETMPQLLRKIAQSTPIDRQEGLIIEAAIERIMAHVNGHSLPTEHPALRNWNRRLRNAAFATMAGKFGIAAAKDAAIGASELGVKGMMRQFPSMMQFRTRMTDGSLKNKQWRILERINGTGSEQLNNLLSSRLDMDDVDSLAGNVADRSLHALTKFVSQASGLAAVDSRVRLAFAGEALNQWVDAARGRASVQRTISDKRLAAMGLTRPENERIIAMLKLELDKGNVKVDKRGGVTLFNEHMVEDQQAAAILFDAIDKWANRQVYKPNLGELPLWFDTDLGKLLFQFKSFHTGSYEARTLTNAHLFMNGDKAHVARETASTMFFEALAYMGLAYGSAQTLPSKERREYLEKRLSDEAIGTAVLTRIPMASIFPNLINTGLWAIGGGRLGPEGYSGTSKNLVSIDGVPAVKVFSNAAGLLEGSLGAAFTEEQFDQTDWKHVQKLIPMNAFVGLEQALDLVRQQFPQRDPR